MTVLNDRISVNAVFLGMDNRIVEKAHIIWYKDVDPENIRLPGDVDCEEIREEIRQYHGQVRECA